MGPLPRFAKVALASTFLLALTSLPATLEDRIPGNGVAPTIAWAGGSPDETLKPPEPPRARALNTHETDFDRTSSEFGSAFARLKGADRWEFVLRIILTSTHRF